MAAFNRPSEFRWFRPKTVVRSGFDRIQKANYSNPQFADSTFRGLSIRPLFSSPKNIGLSAA